MPVNICFSIGYELQNDAYVALLKGRWRVAARQASEEHARILCPSSAKDGGKTIELNFSQL